MFHWAHRAINRPPLRGFRPCPLRRIRVPPIQPQRRERRRGSLSFALGHSFVIRFLRPFTRPIPTETPLPQRGGSFCCARHCCCPCFRAADCPSHCPPPLTCWG